MACPTCSHTLSVLGVIEGRRHLHCPRCGTHRIECGYAPDGAPIVHDTVPRLVGHVRGFLSRTNHIPTPANQRLMALAHTDGLIDAALPLEGRP